MPPIIAAVVGIAATAIGGALGLGAVLTAVLSTVVTIGIGFVAKALSPKPGQQEPADLAGAAARRTQMIRSPRAARRVVIGETKLGGVIVRYASTENKRYHHMVVALCEGPVEAIPVVWANDQPIYEDQLDPGGHVIAGPFAGKLRLKKHLGAVDQAADGDLVAEVPGLDANCRGRGVAYLYARIEWNRDVYPTGLPGFSAEIRGSRFTDSRDAAEKWTPNVAVNLRGYLASPRFGLGEAEAALPDDYFDAAANVCDEFVVTAPQSHQILAVHGTASNAVDGLTLLQGGDYAADPAGNAVALTGGSGSGATASVATARVGELEMGPGIEGTAYLPADARRYAVTSVAIAAGGSGYAVGDTLTLAGAGGDAAATVRVASLKRQSGLDLDGDKLRFQTGDRVQATSTGTLPAGLTALTDYYVIVRRSRRAVPDSGSGGEAGAPKLRPSEQTRPIRIELAASYANALAGIAVAITNGGTGVHTITKTAEPRYTANGVFELNRPPHEHLDALVRAMAGRAVWAGGAWRALAGSYAAATVTLDENEFIGPLKVQTRISRRDRFNAVKGIYVSPLNDWQPADFPAVTNAAYETEDQGERIWKDHDLDLVSRPGHGQRLGKIELARARQEITVEGVFSLRAFQLQAGDTVALSHARFGWSNKPFEITSWRFVLIQDRQGMPLLAIAMSLRETASAIFDWTYGADETTIDPAPNTTLPSAFAVGIPGAPAIAESLFEGRDGSDIKTLAAMSWAESADALVTEYEAEYKLAASAAWLPAGAGRVPATVRAVEILDIEPGRYDFRVRARNWIGRRSDWIALLDCPIVGLAAAPVAMTGLGLQKLGGQALLRWDLHADADVRRGGWIEFRHSPVDSGASASESTTIGDRVDGRSTVAVVPLKAGTYFARAVDKSGNSGPWTSVASDGALQLAYAAVGGIVEDPAFAGANAGTVSVASTLKLDGTTAFDSWANVDAIVDWDSDGGIVASGTYTFSAGIDLGSVQRGRLRGHLRAVIDNTLDLLDSRTSSIDDWQDFDGTAPGAADAWIEFRQTQDDPAGTPAWTPWLRLDVNEVNARAFEFRARLVSVDPAYNVAVTELRAYVEDPAL